MRIVLFASLASLAFCQAAPALAAPEGPQLAVAQETQGYDRLYDVLVSDPDGLGARRLAAITVGVMNVQVPEHAEIEADNPGFLADLERSLMPVITMYMERNRDIHRDDFLAAVTPLISEEEALELAEFYESELGTVVMRASRDNYQLDMTSEELLATDDFTRDDAERSVEVTRVATTQAITPAQLDAVDAYLTANPGLMRSIELVREPMIDIRVSMDNEELNGEEEALFRQIYADVLARYDQ